MSSGGNDMRVHLVVASNYHHGPYQHSEQDVSLLSVQGCGKVPGRVGTAGASTTTNIMVPAPYRPEAIVSDTSNTPQNAVGNY